MAETVLADQAVARAVMALLVADTAHALSEWGRLQSDFGGTECPRSPESWTAAPITPVVAPSSAVRTPKPVSVESPVSAPVAASVESPASTPLPASVESPVSAESPASTPTSATALFASLRSHENTATAQNRDPLALKQKLDETIRNCRLCGLGRRREDVLTGYGPIDARLMFVFAGGNPHELEEKHILTGEAAALMDNIIAAMGALSPHAAKDRIYFTNVIKCEAIPAPNQRKECSRACLNHLREEVRIIQPDVIVVFGQTAYSAMFGDEASILSVRGQIRRFEQIVTIPTHHPMEILKNKQLKRPVWNDVREAIHQLRPTSS